MGQCCSRKSMDGLNMEDRTNYLGNVHVINTREEWESKLSEATDEKIAIVVFTASWCGPCKTIEPYFAELSDKYPQMMFLVVDVDEMPVRTFRVEWRVGYPSYANFCIY
eukprot:TRINITY_DN2569_c0_g3_i1.p1 TRINITY_DN2569_c0_g3~~TRINITY_DN2569_c0_g3_i1.p1  ORF type:complete len:109 (-),score=13.90 TRINITY_DN2569_c0_g3_i1:131-457(-)